MEPALTAEEWAHWSDPDAWWGYAGRSLKLGVTAYNQHRRGTAALALHGQPFGFTWEDVHQLHALFVLYKPPGLDGLADRIAALLPPRPTD